VADTKRALHEIDVSPADLELIETLLTTRSQADAVFAYSMLRQVLPSRSLVMLANLREVIAALPDPPFKTGTGMDALASAGGYENAGHSFRRLFDSDNGMFGLEFVGGGTLCEGIVVRTATSRFVLHGCEASSLEHDLLGVLLSHEALLDVVIEGLQVLGYEFEPDIYVTPDDFIFEHGTTAASEALGNLF